MKRRYYSTAGIAPALDDPNYPGIPAAPSHVAKSTVKSQVDYPTFVNGYARRISSYAFTMVAGITAVIGSYIHVRAEWGVILIAVGAGMVAAGGAGLLATWASHEQWYNAGLGVSTTETYAPTPTPKPETVRPFIATANPNTISTGRLRFAPTVWQSLIDMALANGGTITRDIAMKAGVGREWYNTHPDAPGGFQALLLELRRLRFIDHRNRITDIMLTWYEAQYPALPLTALAMRPANARPPDGADDAPDDAVGVGEWE